MKLIKSYNFWIRLVAVVVLLLRVVGAEFGLEIDSGLIIDIATAVASVLVVLGVIQVPVTGGTANSEDGNINGGMNMESFNKIREDILSAKEKLVNNFEDSELLQEVTKLLDGVLGTEVAETLREEKKLQTIVIESGEVAMAEESIAPAEQETTQPNIMESESAAEDVEVEVAVHELEQDATPSLEPVEDAAILPDTEDKIKEVLRARIREVFERELDDIIAQIS